MTTTLPVPKPVLIWILFVCSWRYLRIRKRRSRRDRDWVPQSLKYRVGHLQKKKNVPTLTDVLCLIAFLQGNSRIQTLHVCNAEVFYMGQQVHHGVGRKSWEKHTAYITLAEEVIFILLTLCWPRLIMHLLRYIQDWKIHTWLKSFLPASTSFYGKRPWILSGQSCLHHIEGICSADWSLK